MALKKCNRCKQYLSDTLFTKERKRCDECLDIIQRKKEWAAARKVAAYSCQDCGAECTPGAYRCRSCHNLWYGNWTFEHHITTPLWQIEDKEFET